MKAKSWCYLFFFVVLLALTIGLVYHTFINEKVKGTSKTSKTDEQFLHDNIYNGDEWNEYRIGDVFKGYKGKWSIESHRTKFPKSVAAEYLRRNGTKTNENLPLLMKIL